MNTDRSSIPANKQRSKWQFNLRTLFMILVFIGLLAGWMVDHWHLRQQLQALQNDYGIVTERFDAFAKWFGANYSQNELPLDVKRVVDEARHR